MLSRLPSHRSNKFLLLGHLLMRLSNRPLFPLAFQQEALPLREK
jgi:hypothetical protein